MWSDLPKPWQACFELAWEAYCDDCIPIGAVVTDPDGNVLTRGRNRINEKIKPGGHMNGAALAHAEVEALRTFDFDAVDPHACVLYTTTEPCTMCMGMFYMSGLRTLHYAARDPWAGSVNMLGTTWYLSRKPIKVFGPLDPRVETILVALFVEQDCGFHDGRLPEGAFYPRLAEVVSPGIEFGKRLWQSGQLRQMHRAGIPADEVFNRLIFLVQ